nr:multidrug resistance efflux transporter family protein [Brevibacillus sp. SYP-B805]
MLGILSAFFFTFTFVLNRAMDLSGGSWIWSASLRYLFMVPFLLAIVAVRGNLRELFVMMKGNPGAWLGWSFVGFGLFYGPLCFAAAYGPGWLIAGTWQITIVAGSLLVPFFYEEIRTAEGTRRARQRMPVKGLLMSLIILVGVGLMQMEEAGSLSPGAALYGIVPVVVAAFAYPLGNRKMIAIAQGRLDAYQRLLGMTLASLPCWLLLAAYGLVTEGLPSAGQAAQSLVVALSSGVIATALFFKATDMTEGHAQKLAAVEATQSAEVVFAVLLEAVWLSAPLPSIQSLVGILLVMAGMILHSYFSHSRAGKKPINPSASVP